MLHIHQFVICRAEQLKPSGRLGCSAVLMQEKHTRLFLKPAHNKKADAHVYGRKIRTNYTINTPNICNICLYIWSVWAWWIEKRKQFGSTSSTPLLDFHNELSVISQRPTTFICPDSSQPPPFITPLSPLRHTPLTPCVVYHVRWNRVSPAVNLGNAVTSETLGTLALISDCNVMENDEHFQQLVTLASARMNHHLSHKSSSSS